jgi:hypothetical protein
VGLIKVTKSTFPCPDRGQSLNQRAVGPTASAYIMGMWTKVFLCCIQYTYTGVWSPRALQRWDASLSATDPFFHDADAASVHVRQQTYGMAKSPPHSSSYPLDSTPRGPSYLQTMPTRGCCSCSWAELLSSSSPDAPGVLPPSRNVCPLLIHLGRGWVDL